MGLFQSIISYKLSTDDINYISMIEDRVKDQERIIEELEKNIKDLEYTIKVQTDYLSYNNLL